MTNKVTLYSSQRETVERFVEGLKLQQGPWQLYNPQYRPLVDMVLKLPNCKDLSEQDVFSIVLSALFRFGGEPEEGEELRTPEAAAAEVTRFLIDLLESLPRAYILRIYLPRMPYWGEFEMNLSEDVVLKAVPPGAQESGSDRIVRAMTGEEPSAGDPPVRLELTIRGYANASSPNSHGLGNAVAVAKQLSFLMVYARLGRSASWQRVRATARLSDSATAETSDFRLPEGLAIELGSLEADTEVLKVWEPGRGGGLLSGEMRLAQTEAEKLQAFLALPPRVRRFYSRSHLPGFDRVAAAIEWHQDSLQNDDQTLAFLAACIGLESVFGEEDKGMTELSSRLQDRYAFMLGTDREDRKRLAKEFADVLQVRGALVHARATRLRDKDLRQLHKVRQMLWASIHHELKPFIAESPK